MHPVVAYLHAVNPLSADCARHIEAALKFRTLARRERFLNAGTISKEICFIHEGILRSYHYVGDREVGDWFMREGDIAISPVSFFEQAFDNKIIEAITECKITYITYAELDQVCTLFPHFEKNRRLITEKYYCLQCKKDNIRQIPKLEERYQFLLNHYRWMVQRIPSRHIACFLGVTEQQLSKIRAQIAGHQGVASRNLCAK